jgi:hypothetical protein
MSLSVGNIINESLGVGASLNIIDTSLNGVSTDGKIVVPSVTAAHHSRGNTITVDAVYGDELVNSEQRYTRPFKTIRAALAVARAGDIVFLTAGEYDILELSLVTISYGYVGPIVIPAGVSIRGAGTKVCSINALNVTVAATLITMGSQSRLEDVTLNLSSAANVDLIGIDFPSGTPQTANVVSCILRVISTGTGNVTGIRSEGTSSTESSSSTAVHSSIISVYPNGSGTNRCILVSNSNRFTLHDSHLYVNGSGANNVGVETTVAGAICELKTCTVSSATTNVVKSSCHDILRSYGQIILTSTELSRKDAGTQSFTSTSTPTTLTFGMIGNPVRNRRYYLIPGPSPINWISNTENTLWEPTRVFPNLWNNSAVVFTLTLAFTGVISAGESITFNIHKGTASGAEPTTPTQTAVLSITLEAGQRVKSLTTLSHVFNVGDTMACTIVTVGNPGFGTCIGTLGIY